MANKTKVAIASDKAGYALKSAVAEYLRERDDIELLDLGQDSADEAQPYDGQAPKVAQALQRGEAERGILICGTGQGMAIVANKHKGVYAVVADTVFAGSRGRVINNANVLTMGGWITAPMLGGIAHGARPAGIISHLGTGAAGADERERCQKTDSGRPFEHRVGPPKCSDAATGAP